MKNVQKHHKCIIVVFCFMLAVFVTQIFALVDHTWWVCNINAKAPLLNLTMKPRDSVTVSIRMRTGLADACWYVEEVDSTSMFSNILMSSSPIKKCFSTDLINQYNRSAVVHQQISTFDQHNTTNTTTPGWETMTNEFETSRSGFDSIRSALLASIVFSGLSWFIGVVNIFLCNGYLVMVNAFIIFPATLSTITSFIYSKTKLNHYASFIETEKKYFPDSIMSSELLTEKGQTLIPILYKKLIKSPQVFYDNCEKGQAYTYTWVCLILLILAFFVCIVGHILGVKSGDRDYNKTPSGVKGRDGLSVPSFDDLDDSLE